MKNRIKISKSFKTIPIKEQVLKKYMKESYIPKQVKKWDKEYDKYTRLFSIGTVEVMLNELEKKTKEQDRKDFIKEEIKWK